MPTVTVRDDALRQVIAGFASFDAEQQKRVQRALSSTAVPLFRKAYTQRLRTTQQRAAGGTGSAKVSGGTVVVAGYGPGSRVLSGGLNAAGGDWPWLEFGSKKAHGRRGQLPFWTRSGRALYPAVNATAKAVASVYLGVTYEHLREVANG